MPNKIDRLFALKALEQKVKEERELQEYECRDDLLEAFEQDGTDRRTSPFFGPEAGKYSIKRIKGKPAQEEVTYALDDDVAFAEWLESNFDSLMSFAKLRASDFSRIYFESTGELPDGIERETHVVKPATEPSVTAQVYSFKPDVVLEKLAENGNVFEQANKLLLEEGE